MFKVLSKYAHGLIARGRLGGDETFCICYPAAEHFHMAVCLYACLECRVSVTSIVGTCNCWWTDKAAIHHTWTDKTGIHHIRTSLGKFAAQAYALLVRLEAVLIILFIVLSISRTTYIG